MGLKKGTTNNPAGKPKGAKNKINADLRERISGFLTDQFPNVMAEYETLSAKDKLKFYTELMQYGIPKLQSVDVHADIQKTLASLNDDQLDMVVKKIIQDAGIK
jgi:hypothetical protein